MKQLMVIENFFDLKIHLNGLFPSNFGISSLIPFNKESKAFKHGELELFFEFEPFAL